MLQYSPSCYNKCCLNKCGLNTSCACCVDHFRYAPPMNTVITTTVVPLMYLCMYRQQLLDPPRGGFHPIRIITRSIHALMNTFKLYAHSITHTSWEQILWLVCFNDCSISEYRRCFIFTVCCYIFNSNTSSVLTTIKHTILNYQLLIYHCSYKCAFVTTVNNWIMNNNE